ncbi:ketol-acid reductoisomerase [Helicobacter enhydrae]|uniref:Ketol-acid reductoisomerase n=1 Tax=Helicobacter enhydrae TaxID=222136 RepID=A0A1B1U684_9HELI|nr:ketol-acid reductoisomerase [Helicobacter enhydrae]ANV98195.1 ketol-acid reductoisomerase [Helicobacter enhydrae]
MQVLTQKDCHTDYLSLMQIGILGFGSQAIAQAQNLRDSGLNVKIGLRNGSNSKTSAEAMGFEVLDLAHLAQECQMLVFLIPDECHQQAYQEMLPYLCDGQVLCFAHGFSVYTQEVVPPSFVDVILVAPKAAASAVRGEYVNGRGVVSLIGVAQDVSSRAYDYALEYACALGSGKSGVLPSSFGDEYECDLFSEQAVICGGLEALICAGFETLVEAGYPAEIAYFECLHELKIVADLIYAQGLSKMREHISNTAEYGAMSRTEALRGLLKESMKPILSDIRSGAFAERFLQERDNGFGKLKLERKALQDLEIEQVGSKIRALMPWLGGK